MQNKKLFIILGFLILLVGAAAFIGGRMLNQQVGPASSGGPPGSNNGSFAVQILPAEELPKTAPEVTGPFVERQDNTIVVSSVPLDAGQGGVVEQSSEGDGGDEPSLTSKDVPDGPKVEVVVTSETIIYRDTTDFSNAQPSGNTTVQETVGEGTLDDLNSDSMVRVWGHKSGDRVIADILFYSSPFVIQGP